MNRRIVAAVILVAILAVASPSVVRGIESFKTFLSLLTLLNPCDGAGSPPPCR